MTEASKHMGLDKAIQKHATAKAEYLAARDRIKTLADNTDRLQKAAVAASDQAKAEGQEWRNKLREDGGELTKSVQKIRRSAVEAAELADELSLMHSEASSQLLAEQLDAVDLRKHYLAARSEALQAFRTKQRLEALEDLLSTPEGQRFIWVCVANREIMPGNGFEVEGVPADDLADQAASEHLEEVNTTLPIGAKRIKRTELASKFGEQLLADLCSIGAKVPNSASEHDCYEDLAVIGYGASERLPDDLTASHAKRMQARQRLRTEAEQTAHGE